MNSETYLLSNKYFLTTAHTLAGRCTKVTKYNACISIIRRNKKSQIFKCIGERTLVPPSCPFSRSGHYNYGKKLITKAMMLI